MKKKYYTIKYPFAKSVFYEKLIARTVPFGFREGLKRPYGRKLEGRVFWGEIESDHFIIVTLPDIWDSVKNPWGIRKIPVWKNPSCIYGILHESDGHTVVDYRVDITEASKHRSISGIVMSCLGGLMCIISVFMEGFHFMILLGGVILSLLCIRSILTLQPHQSEQDALIKFMEDLENYNEDVVSE